MARLRLEYRLPLLVSGIFLVIALTGMWLAYQEVRGAALASADDRIRVLADELGPLVESGLLQRTRLLESAVRQDIVRHAGEPGVRVNMDSLTAALEMVRGTPGTPFVTAILRADGTAVTVGDDVAFPPPPLDALIGFLGPDGPRYTRLFEIGDRVYYWTAVPVPETAAPAFLAQLRRVTSTPSILQDLAGPDAALYLVNAEAERWFALGSPPTAPVVEMRRNGERLSYTRAGRSYMARSRAVPGTPWHVIMELPDDVAFSRAHLFVRRVIGFGMVLAMVGAATAVLAVRRVLRPMAELGEAARGIASGEYGRRVPVHDGDEIGDLADAFNAMASQVELAISEAKHSQGKADEASRAKSAFLATVSHELRTPINAVVGYTELLEMGVAGELSQQQQQYIQRIRTSSEHLTRLVDEILDIGRIEAGQLRIAPRLCSAQDHMRVARDVILPQARVRRVKVELGASDVSFIGDPQRVEQILVNLLSNAVKFSDAGATVSSTCTVADGPGGSRMCRFDVVDRGCGVPAEMHESIFEPFVQVDDSYTRNHGGAGLGLSISRELARLMGGQITLCSTAGRGSTFTLWLPLAPAAVPAPGARPKAPGAETRVSPPA